MQTKGHSNQSLHWTHQFAEEDRVKTPYFLDEWQPQCNPKDLSLSMLLPDRILGSRDGAVVRALAFHQCDPGSIPGLDVICGLSLLLVLFSAPRGFSPGTPVFPSPQKPTFLNSNSIRNARVFNT